MRILTAILIVAMTASFAAEASEGWQKTREGCKLWSRNPQPSDTVSWSGKCPGGKAGGKGTLVSKYREKGKRKKARYVGQMRGGKLHGQGTFTPGNGDRYTGQWKNNKMHGQGTYTMTNGFRHKGQFKNGVPHGTGTCRYPGIGEERCRWVNGELR